MNKNRSPIYSISSVRPGMRENEHFVVIACDGKAVGEVLIKSTSTCPFAALNGEPQ